MFTGDVHCEYCMCPKEVWKRSLRTYDGDECKLYSDFVDVIWVFEEALKPFNNQEIFDKCRVEFEHEYNDIQDFEASITEMIQINVEEGYMPKNYRPIAACKA